MKYGKEIAAGTALAAGAGLALGIILRNSAARAIDDAAELIEEAAPAAVTTGWPARLFRRKLETAPEPGERLAVSDEIDISERFETPRTSAEIETQIGRIEAALEEIRRMRGRTAESLAELETQAHSLYNRLREMLELRREGARGDGQGR